MRLQRFIIRGIEQSFISIVRGGERAGYRLRLQFHCLAAKGPMVRRVGRHGQDMEENDRERGDDVEK